MEWVCRIFEEVILKDMDNFAVISAWVERCKRKIMVYRACLTSSVSYLSGSGVCLTCPITIDQMLLANMLRNLPFEVFKVKYNFI